jgi:hypothetical protein
MAIRLKIGRSKVIAEAIAAQREREEARLAAEGYRFYAQEASEFAAASLQAVSEVLGHVWRIVWPLTNRTLTCSGLPRRK